MVLEIVTVDGGDAALIETARRLIVEYSRELGEDMCFQGFDEEIAALPGKYGPPSGALLLGMVSGVAVGCVALRPLSSTPLPPSSFSRHEPSATNKEGDAGRRASSPDATREQVPALYMACEMKRLYIRPKYRGEAFGRELAEEIVEAARQRGYESMRLDTLARLVPAVMLYRSMGFYEIEPYYDNPIPGVVYMEKIL